MDQSFKDLLEASSLGTPAARRIRSSAPFEVVDEVRRRMEHRREPSLRDAAASAHYPKVRRRLSRTMRGRRISSRIATRSLVTKQVRTGGWLAAYQGVVAQKADSLRARQAGLRIRARYRDAALVAHPDGGVRTVAQTACDQQRVQITADIDRGSRRHRRLPAALRRVPLLAFFADALLLLYFFSGVTNLNWASPLSAALVVAVLLAAMVTGISFAFFRFAGDRLQQYKNDAGIITLRGVDPGTTMSAGLAIGAMVVLAALVFIRVRGEVIDAFGPQAWITANTIGLAVALLTILANFLVVAVRALDGSAEANRLAALGHAIYEPLAWQHRMLRPLTASGGRAAERAAAAGVVAGDDLAAADRIIDAARAVHRVDGPLSEPAISPNDKDGVIGYRRTADTPEVDERGTWRARRSNRRRSSGPAPRLAGPALGRFALVIAVAAAVAAVVIEQAVAPALRGEAVIIVATATANEPAPVLATADQELLLVAGATSNSTAYVVSPDTGQPTLISLTPRKPDGQVEYGSAREQLLKANVAAVQRALSQEAASGPLDLLAALATATRTASPPATVIVLSSGLSTAGGFDLRQVGWDANPASVAAQLNASGLLPDLAGYHVVFSGLGDVTGAQPPLPAPQQATLTEYWLAICRAAGAASCSADQMARPELASHSTTPVPVVPVPEVTSVQGPSGATAFSMSDTLLFDPNSAALVPSADTVLRSLVQQARSQHLAVSITGYASTGGTAAYNLALSQRRATAVQARLIELGLPADQITTVTGVGATGQLSNAVRLVLSPRGGES